MKKWIIITAVVAVVTVGLIFILMGPNLSDKIILPYIAHQKPLVDPHLPSTNALADKLDEVQFDGLFNVSSDASGLVYEDGLASLVSIDSNNVVTLKLNSSKKWHDSYKAVMKEDELQKIDDNNAHLFAAKDVKFTLDRIKSLGTLSPDFILISQALKSDDFTFEGPDEAGYIKFQLRDDRKWLEDDIKEVFSFKILPAGSEINSMNYSVGTSNYMSYPQKSGVGNYHKTPDGAANVSNIILTPFVDNSTFTTELKNGKINVLLNTPFGAISPILEEKQKFFAKPSIPTVFFSVLFNTQKLNRDKRKAVRYLLNNKSIMDRFYKVNTPQQRHIIDYRNNKDKYSDLLNFSVFPSTSYYVEEKIIEKMNLEKVNTSINDTVRIAVCLNYGFREELTELSTIISDPSVTGGKLKVVAVSNDEIKTGNYDAVLVAFSGYRSNFLFDLYDIFLREPDLEIYKINLATEPGENGKSKILGSSLKANHNFFRMDPSTDFNEGDDMMKLIRFVYGFMSTRKLGDKQAYAQKVDELEQEMCLGAWMFSLPSLAYFNSQFDPTSINLYGVGSQLSTIEKWKERPKK